MNKFIYAVAFCALLCGCVREAKQQDESRYVETVTPASVGTDSQKHYSGTVKEAAHVNVAFKTAGQLSKILVREGSRVTAGQLIATLDDSDYLLGVKAAESQYKQLKGEVERLRVLHEGKALSGNDYE